MYMSLMLLNSPYDDLSLDKKDRYILSTYGYKKQKHCFTIRRHLES